MNPHIFREYDIRGIVSKDLTEDVVNALGRGFGAMFIRAGIKRISVARDGRISSPEIRDWLIAGITSTGMNVIDLGMVPTPISYYSTHKLDIGGAIMITGSHNPPDYNGFKISLGHEALYGEQIQEIKTIIESGNTPTGKGTIEEYNLVPEYLADLNGRLQLTRSVKVVVDCGNGVAGITAAPLLEQLGCDAQVIYNDVNGKFPNHHPDPTVEANLADLKRAVTLGGYELGIGFDGDGDRIGIVDENGKVLWGDQLLAILARDILKENPSATIIAEVKCSQLLFDDITRHGGNALMWKVGHSLIKNKMNETGALLAGEMSGHIFFKHRFYGFDDATYVMGRMLELITKSSKPVSRMLEDWHKVFNTPEIRLECPDDIKFQVVNAVRDAFITKYKVVDVDGMRVITPHGWGLLRASNTQPVCVLRFEANSLEHLQEIKTLVQNEFVKVRDALLKK